MITTNQRGEYIIELVDKDTGEIITEFKSIKLSDLKHFVDDMKENNKEVLHMKKIRNPKEKYKWNHQSKK